MVRGVAWVALLVAAGALAGCSGEPPTGPTSGLLATDTTGVILGVVVDEAIRPVANVTVTARGPDGVNQTATTDLAGLFGFAGLAPGTWFLLAEKVAYESAQTSSEVVAGVDDPPVAKLQMTFVPGAVPFSTSVKLEAFVQCIVPGANMCAIINLYPCEVANYCEPIVDDTSFVQLDEEVVSLQRIPDFLQTEVVWQSTQSLSPALSIRYSGPGGGGALGDRQDRMAGPSPLIIPIDNARLTEWEVGTAGGLSHEIFGHMEQTSAIGSVGVVLNQRVDFYFTIFYGYLPPEGWTFSGDGYVPAPPT